MTEQAEHATGNGSGMGSPACRGATRRSRTAHPLRSSSCSTSRSWSRSARPPTSSRTCSAKATSLSGIGAFAFAMFATCWAWINFSWFASAYDTDDWFYRTTTMVQMIGVIVFALGIPAFFASVDAGHGVDNSVMVAGYVVMRVALVVQWCRVAVQDPAHRRAALAYAGFVSVAQIGWVVIAFAHLPLGVVIVAAPVIFVIEVAAPGRHRDPLRRHPVASAPHRRAVRAPHDHRPRRSALRNRRLRHGPGGRAGLEHGGGDRRRRRASASSSACGGPTSSCPRAPSSRVTGAARSSGGTATSSSTRPSPRPAPGCRSQRS